MHKITFPYRTVPNRTEPFQTVTYRKTTVDDRIRPLSYRT
jgi:hypothetical protein